MSVMTAAATSAASVARRHFIQAGRLIAICDVYDALTRRRSYKTAIRPHQAIDIMQGMNRRMALRRRAIRQVSPDRR